MTRKTSGSPAHAELARALAAHGPQRIEGLVTLSQEQPRFAPVWVALAEEHWRSRRTEEAIQAARRALQIDPSVHTEFSPGLSDATESLVPKRSSAPLPDVSIAPPERVDSRKRTRRPVLSAAADKALEQASILVGYRRRERLEELSQENPDHPPTWLALAEETLVQRSFEQAMEAANHAISMDPSLEAMMSPPLARAWKYHKVEQRITAAQKHNSRDSRPSSRQASANSGTSAGTASGSEPLKPYQKTGSQPAQGPLEPDASNSSAVTKPRLEKMLATALGLRSRNERINVLEQLLAMDPQNEDVLFHVAKEMALDGRMDGARKMGDALRLVSTERYTELYTWAESHWNQPHSQPERSQPEHSQPEHSQPERSQPERSQPERSQPEHPSSSSTRDSRPQSAQAMDHSQENAQFRTRMMDLSEVQRLADESRPMKHAPDTQLQLTPPDTQLQLSPPDTQLELGPPMAHTDSHEPTERSAPPTSHELGPQPVDLSPHGRNHPSDTVVQLRAPAAGAGDRHTQRMDVDDLAERPASMPSWLDQPTPWETPARGTQRSSDKPQSQRPPPRRPLPEPRRRAHPRLVRRSAPDKRSDKPDDR